MDTLEVAVGCDGTLHLPICAGGLTRVPLRLAALLREHSVQGGRTLTGTRRCTRSSHARPSLRRQPSKVRTPCLMRRRCTTQQLKNYVGGGGKAGGAAQAESTVLLHVSHSNLKAEFMEIRFDRHVSRQPPPSPPPCPRCRSWSMHVAGRLLTARSPSSVTLA
jgi:hypothetical protein